MGRHRQASKKTQLRLLYIVDRGADIRTRWVDGRYTETRCLLAGCFSSTGPFHSKSELQPTGIARYDISWNSALRPIRIEGLAARFRIHLPRIRSATAQFCLYGAHRQRSRNCAVADVFAGPQSHLCTPCCPTGSSIRSIASSRPARPSWCHAWPPDSGQQKIHFNQMNAFDDPGHVSRFHARNIRKWVATPTLGVVDS